MTEQTKILFATDFSHTAKIALSNLQYYMKAERFDIYLMHVLTKAWENWFSSGLTEKEAFQRLALWQEKIKGTNDFEKILILSGDPSALVVATANKLNVNCIMLGGEKKDPHAGFITGSVAQKIVRHASQNVYLSKSERITKILCAIDGSEHSNKALDEAISLASRLKAELVITHILPLPDFNPLGMSNEDIAEQEEADKQQRIEVLEQFLSKVDFQGVSYRSYYPWGKPSRVILNMAYDFNYDLIVMGSKGHSNVPSVLLGSTANSVVKYAPCSLLVVK